jgi:hypothetical protein
MNGIVLDCVKSSQHSSLAETSTKNLLKCDDRVIPTTAPLTDQTDLNQAKGPITVYSRQKKQPQTKSDDFLW